VKEFTFMQNEKVVSDLTDKIREYAAGRAKDVARGAETPWRAALPLQKYGLGLLHGARIALGCSALSAAVLDEETAKIDPEWREHNKQRWEARPAGISV
jgi:hypothetical protein